MNRARTLRRVLLAHALLAAAALAQSVTLPGLLQEMTDRGAITRVPEPWYACRQASSYDRASVSPEDHDTWFANGDVDKFLRTETNNGRQEWVMLDEPGPGAIVRIWSANPKGTLRVYIDDAYEPAIEAPMADLLAGTAEIAGVTIGTPLAEVRSRGCNIYLPIPYANRCKVTSDEPGFYYQINYRAYDAETSVESFSHGSLQRSAALLQRTQQRLADPWLALAPALKPITLQPGETAHITLPTGPAVVRELHLQLPPDAPRDILRWVVLEGRFDAEPCVWAPIGDFFLTGPLLNPVHTWTNQVDPEKRDLRSAWLMPYAKSAALMLHNLGDQPVTLNAGVSTADYRWDSRAMHFHARWRQQTDIPTRPMRDWNYIEARGTGLYVGDTLSVANPVADWWGEGDEKIYTDGETFPSHFGTGTEDYYGYAWCCPDVFQGPFHAQPRCDGPGNYGHTTVARVRLLDTIPFKDSIRTDMEVWHWADCNITYAATTFLYMLPEGATNRAPQPEEAAKGVIDPAPLPPPFTIEGALECEDLEVVNAAEGMPLGKQDMGAFARDKWSNNTHLWAQGRRPGDFVEIRIPSDAPMPQRLTLFATKSWDYGILRFSVNGQPAGADLDCYSGREGLAEPSGPIDLGVHSPRDGAFILRAEVIGGNAASAGSQSFFGLDAVLLNPAN